ncbi:structural maintenance of chromosomes flexible hinge domain-containing protein 1 [Marchantia polymorpha subsp. ruderalis]|uniref:Uncharacterized protein n=2 Tax=Marchantia polymorpha TaxID=3197 RepID=A0AAF6BX74_MARPO|nr:hypothetical protein MARPO_0076s0015 [Marchantia polymorpha]BBN16608.1 hypothetical protein Mp_7g07790 [Marchantia polymorpha subsp. ruderalis]|eukprot:PTQ34769.1 hypothetical protein MARPO_0076s0015 [Marchantia polymorpha]
MSTGNEEPDGGGTVSTPEDSEKERRWNLRSYASQKSNASAIPPTPVQQRSGKRVLSTPDESPSETRKKLKYLNVLKLHILLPNGTSVDVILNLAEVSTIEGLLNIIRDASNATHVASDSRGKKPQRLVNWEGGELSLQTLAGDIVDIQHLANLAHNRTSTSNSLLLLDGLDHDSTWVDENLWNVTPKPEMLGQLPQGYTLETALADQVDNALQAVWPNQEQNERRLVSVDLGDDKISIFDTGQGMDSSLENCIANWGTVGGSTHRSVHYKGIGGEPPYLKPYLGKYGAGGVAAALHLGGCVTVYSKTKQSKKVVTLKLEQKALVQKHKLDPEQGIWRTRGELREMTKMEKEKAPHGSFTRVVISKLKSQYCMKGSNQYWKVEKVKQLLKDIYFPYIQSESASRTITPVEFEVNGTNLLEVTECEMAIANQLTCIGAPFVFSIHMTKLPEDRSIQPQLMDEANARITCQYFPIQRGKEALEIVLEEVSKLRPGTPVTFETMHRVVVRWLGRLLPEAKWNILPFMEVTAKKEQRSHVRQQWAKRVRAYVETDAGFQPNQSKVELDRDHLFTLALKQLGAENPSESSEAGVKLEIKFSGKNKPVSPTQLVEEYFAWLEEMHSKYDEEVTFLDEPAWLFSHPNADKELGVYKQGYFEIEMLDSLKYGKSVMKKKKFTRLLGSVLSCCSRLTRGERWRTTRNLHTVWSGRRDSCYFFLDCSSLLNIEMLLNIALLVDSKLFTEFTSLEPKPEAAANLRFIVFHKRLKDTTGEWIIDSKNPVRVRFLRGAGSLKNDLFATLEYFFKEGDDEHGEVKVLCRAIDVDESEGCRLFEKNGRLCFELNKSQWLPGSVLNGGKCQRVDPASWKKKLDELLNKAPGYIDILDEEDLQKFEFSGAFPKSSSKFEAGYTLPPEVLVVVRPKKGTGPSHKQGMIVAEPMSMKLTVNHCKCTGPSCRMNTRKSSPGGASSSSEEHSELVCKLVSRSIVTKTGVKGLYSFNVGSSDASRLTRQGTYLFHFSSESEKCTSIRSVTSSIRIVPSRNTSNWHLSTQAKVANLTSSNPSTLVIRVNDKFRDDLILRKYDEFGNPQTFDKAMPVEVKIVTPRGESLEMTQKVTAHIALSEGRQQGGGLQIKGLLFSSGHLMRVEPTYDALLRVHVADDKYGQIPCKVLPGVLASVRVKDSRPPISMEPVRVQESLRAGDKVDKCLNATEHMCFDEQLRPGDIIKRLTLQGLDASGNKIDKDQKMQVKLKGLEFQDNLSDEREVDENGCLHLGGLLRVTSQHDYRGYVGILSETGKPICNIYFKTVTRKLIATQVPSKSFVGRDMEGITVKIVDEHGTVDTGIDGYNHSVSVDWQKGVAFPFVKGECVLPPVRLPNKPGWWQGRVRFSANQSLCVELKVELELSVGCVLKNPANTQDEVLIARCGSAFEFPFWVADERGHPALIPESIKNTIVVKAEAQSISGDEALESWPRPCMVTCSNIVKTDKDGDGYKADVVLTGDIGIYSLVMMDTSSRFKGEVKYTCKLNPGKVSHLVVEIHHPEVREQFGMKALHIPINEEFPKVEVTLLDSENNLCTYCEGKDLRMIAELCPQFKEIRGKVCKGTALFNPFTLDIPVGSYTICISLDTPESLDYRFCLVVEHGTYPSALKLLDNADIVVALAGPESQVVLPTMGVEVESASGSRVQWRKLSVGLRMQSLYPVPVHMPVPHAREFLGNAIDSSVPESTRQEDSASSSRGPLSDNSVRYEFRDVHAPTTAGNYTLEFFIRGFALETQCRHLRVTHGPPCKLDIVRGPSGESLEVLQVNLLDAYGNKCESVSGIDISLRFSLNQAFSQENPSSPRGLQPCSVYSRKSSTIVDGKADFGPFLVTDGLPAVYVLEVYAENVALTSAEVQIFVTRGEPTESIRQQLVKVNEERGTLFEYCKLLSLAKEHVGHRQRERDFLSGAVRKLEEEKAHLLQSQREVSDLQKLNGDDALLADEDKQQVRAEKHVIQDLMRLNRSGTNAPLLFLEAQSRGNFLSPTTEVGRDIVGLLALLARVESNLLNRALFEFLGVPTLLLMVCRTQRGVNALEEYDRNNNIDVTKGLHGFARSKMTTLSRRFECLALSDTRPYRRHDGKPSVYTEHPQRLLNIDPPILPTTQQPPDGFLGYAVNLLHLKEEHLGGIVPSIDGQPPAEPLNLRETLFHHLLQNLQVYDTREHMLNAKNSIRFTGGAVSLDGGFIRKNLRQQLGRRSENVLISFANVEKEQRMCSSLLPPACYAFERMYKYIHLRKEISLRDEELSVKVRELGNCDRILQGVVASANKVGGQCDIIERTANIKRKLEELGKAEKLLLSQSDDARKAKDQTSAKDLSLAVMSEGRQPANAALSMEEFESKRMRAFIM